LQDVGRCDVIRSQTALLRHAQDFFLSDLVGYYSFEDTKIAAPEMREPIPADLDYRKRRAEMEKRQGLGKYVEQARISFKPWELLIYSSMEKPPVGWVALRKNEFGADLVEIISGPLDPATWRQIGEAIRGAHRHRRAG
jgi:hypothetical protein